MDAAVAHLLDFSKEFDITLLDQIVDIAFNSSHPRRAAANEFLVQIKDHPDMWKRADAILETSKNPATRFFGLQVLGDAILTRWKVIPVEQREGIRNYIVGKIMNLSSSPTLLRDNSSFLSRLNLVLVNILKQDWPHNWPSFISDLVGSSKTSESLCENNMQILQLLSEEVFDFSIDSLTSAKARSMKESLNEEFAQIFQLCQFILDASTKKSLLIATLKTLERFLSWIPLGYIFETSLLGTLISKFFPVPAFRTYAIDCMTEIASLPANDIPVNYNPSIQMILLHLLSKLREIIPIETNLAEAYAMGTEQDQLFVSRLALFLCTYLRSFGKLLEKSEHPELQHCVVEAMTYLVMIAEVDDEEIFKTCLEFLHQFAKDLFTGESNDRTAAHFNTLMDSSLFPAPPSSARYDGIYASILHRLRIVMIDKMAKPEEVIVVEDDDGHIVRELTKDTEVIAQYKTMREAIVFLTHLNYDDTELIMLQKLELQVAGGKFTWVGLNTLCWAIGSISGAMNELDEKRFLVTVIKDLLRLCEEQRGKDNKAVVASNIMYIVGQYPRFLRAHWKFLKTVVNKLFEFMHELHPGVQDMACDTFLKISQKCKRKFMTLQVEETQPFVLTLINDLSRHTQDLQPHQVQSFYESVACMLSDQGQAIMLQRSEIIVRLMSLPNATWGSIVDAGKQNIEMLFQLDTVKEMSKVLRINTRVCTAVGSIYIHQLSNIFLDMINIYCMYSAKINETCHVQGEMASRYTFVKSLRSAKTDMLDLLIAFIESSVDLEQGSYVIMNTFLPPMEEVLKDYRTTLVPARDSKVLILYATLITVLKSHMNNDLPKIMDYIFQPTLEMITKNMSDYPEHRLAFFKFLREANNHCFYGLFSIPSHIQKLVIDSIVWAFKHTERNISETGLEILQELLQNVGRTPPLAQAFYQQFFLPLLQDLFGIMTDRLHKSSFKLQAVLLNILLNLLKTNQVLTPLQDLASGASATQLPDGSYDNATFVKEYISMLLSNAFPNLLKSQIIAFIVGLFEVPYHPGTVNNAEIQNFKQHLRDFLITIKEFQNDNNNNELFNEEVEAQLALEKQRVLQYKMSVPGLLAPSELAAYRNGEENDMNDDGRDF